MTTVVWDGRTLSADSRCTYTGFVNTWTGRQKLVQRKGTVSTKILVSDCLHFQGLKVHAVGFSGDVQMQSGVLDLIKDGSTLDLGDMELYEEFLNQDIQFSFLVVLDDIILIVEHVSPSTKLHTRCFKRFTNGDYVAVGSGAGYAYASNRAYGTRYSGREAVVLASALDGATGGAVQVWTPGEATVEVFPAVNQFHALWKLWVADCRRLYDALFAKRKEAAV